MDSRILKELYETALGMHQAGTMNEQVYLKFKHLYDIKISENKVSKKSK